MSHDEAGEFVQAKHGDALAAVGAMERPLPRLVVCAALRVGHHVVCGPRHFDPVMRQSISAIKAAGGPSFATAEQGFADQRGEWMTREEGWGVAHAAGQIRRSVTGDATGGCLYSENLY